MNELQLVWGWQPALYLFLGGMGAGAFIMASVASFIDEKGTRKAVGISMWSSVACLIVGLLLLVSELVFPLRGMMLWQSFSHWTSWMTFGAWAVFAAVIVFGLSAIVSTQSLSERIGKTWKGYENVRGALRRPLLIVGVILGVCVAVYTGVLLMSVPGTPLWETPLLPCLFTVSALDTGIALYEIASISSKKKEAMPEKVHRLSGACTVILVAAELVILAAMLFAMSAQSGVVGSDAETAAYSASLLTSGPLAPFFWILVVVLGLLLPMAMAIVGMKRSRSENADGARTSGTAVASVPHVTHASNAMLIGAFGALVGGCALRFLILAAGVHADPVAASVISLL